MANDKKNGTLAQIAAAVVMALLVGGTSPWWWNELIGGKSGSNPPPTLPPDSSPQTASITVAYGGDYRCSLLPLAINIGNQIFTPKGSAFEVNNIETGQQKYQISGTISCPTNLMPVPCQVSGEGFIDVNPGKTYYLVWQNTNSAQCKASLQ